MVVIYLVYGLAFFSAGVLLAFQSQLPTTLLSRRSLACLAAFGLTHGAFEWLRMVKLTLPSPAGSWNVVERILLAVSFAFVMQFAVEVLVSHARVPAWMRSAGAAFLVLIVLVVTAVAQAPAGKTPSTEALVRYALGFPGAVLAAIALRAIAHAARRVESDGRRLGRWLSLAAGVFVVYGFLAGVVVPRATFFPASSFNADAFLVATGMRIEIFRAACGLLIAVSLSAAFVVESAREHADWERRREEFITVVAHDLRSPIGTITLGADSLERLLDPSAQLDLPRARRLLPHLKASATRLDRMVSDLVDSSRIEAQRLDLRLQTVDLPPLMRGAIDRAAMMATGNTLNLIVPESLPRIAADPARVEQIVVNLVSNAAKYSTPESEIRIEAFRCDAAVEIAVTNLGEGLPPEEQERLFTRFYRATHRGKDEGLGLGLYIAKGLVEAHGGQIWVESTRGAYTTFSFSLPFGDARETRSAHRR